MEMIYEATPRRMQVSEDDDDDDNVIFSARGLEKMDEQALMKGGSKSAGVSKVKAPSKLDVTLNLFLSFFGLGVVLSLLGPMLLDLSYHLDKSLDEIAYVFTTRSIGYFCGTLGAGFLFDMFDANFLLGIALNLTAIGTMVAPLWSSVFLLAGSTFVQGISMGFLDTGGNVLLLGIWGKDNGPYMQTLHFSFALGAMIAPLIAKPFVSPAPLHNCTLGNASAASTATLMATTARPLTMSVSTIGNVTSSTLASMATTFFPATTTTAAATTMSVPITSALVNGTAASVSNITNSTLVQNASVQLMRHGRAVAEVSEATVTTVAVAATGNCGFDPAMFTGRFKYAFFISGLPLLLAGGVFVLFSCRKRGIRYHAPSSSNEEEDTVGTKPANGGDAEGGAAAADGHAAGRLTGCMRWQFLVLLAFFFLLYVGLEVGYGAFIYPYAIRSEFLLMSSDSASMLTTTFWGLFAIGRFLAIPLAWCKVPPGAMILLDLIGALVAAIGLMAFQKSHQAVWLGTALMGLSQASVFPTAISWAEQYTEITSKAALIFVVGAAIGEMIGPLCLGYLFEHSSAGPRSLMPFTVVVISLGIALFTVLFLFARRQSARSLCCCWPLGDKSATLSRRSNSSKRKHYKTRRERNASMELSKHSRTGSAHAWASSESDVL